MNLAANAVKFTERGSVRLSVTTTVEGGRILRVEDTGPGIPQEEQVRIFEPFERLEPMRHKHVPGVGLGLAIVRDLTRAIGGTIQVSSEPGRGAVFDVSFPREVGI
jgi:signal transduction histidine kinase